MCVVSGYSSEAECAVWGGEVGMAEFPTPTVHTYVLLWCVISAVRLLPCHGRGHGFKSHTHRVLNNFYLFVVKNISKNFILKLNEIKT